MNVKNLYLTWANLLLLSDFLLKVKCNKSLDTLDYAVALICFGEFHGWILALPQILKTTVFVMYSPNVSQNTDRHSVKRAYSKSRKLQRNVKILRDTLINFQCEHTFGVKRPITYGAIIPDIVAKLFTIPANGPT